jgi:dipeptidase
LKKAACTSILIGKKASLTGSTLIARNDDTFLPISPQRFYMHPAVKNEPGRILKSYLNDFKAELPSNGYRYNAVPNVNYKVEGYYEESGINEKNVAMSCTESTYGNERTLAYDPLNEASGLDEDCMQNMVLPFVDSARDAVAYLGKLIQEFGSAAGNSVLFSDVDEVWYMEIVTGHHWLAQRIPDDCYAVAANQVAIQWVDFDDDANFMYSEGIEAFVAKHHLNPDFIGFNFRHIFGTDTQKDRHYNTPRVWYAHHLFDAQFPEMPESSELPFIVKPKRKLGIEDIEKLLGSHYNETRFDPLGQGSEHDKLLYRPIGLNRTQNSHILQVRQNEPALMWLNLGMPAFSPYVPFYCDANDTAPSYEQTPMTWDMKSAYWLFRTLSMLVEAHHAEFIQQDIDYLKEVKRRSHAMIAEIDAKAAALTGQALTAFLTQQNYLIVDTIFAMTQDLIGKLVINGLELSKLTFNMDKNL